MVGPSRLTDAIVAGLLHGTGQIMTVIRIILRAKDKRLWYDDAWAVVACVCSIMEMATTFDRLNPSRSQHHMIMSYWIASFSFQNCLWAARLSIVFAILRLIPTQDVLRKRMTWVIASFLGMWIGLLIHKSYICGTDLSWQKLRPVPHCILGLGVAINELVTDIIGDIVLTVIPILLYHNTSLPSHQKSMIFIIFTSSLFITLASAVHAWFLLHSVGGSEGFTAGIECAVALIVANIGVVVSFVYRRFRHALNSDSRTFEYSIGKNGKVRIRHKPSTAVGIPTDVIFASPNRTTGTDSTTFEATKTGEPYELAGILPAQKSQYHKSASSASIVVHTNIETVVA